MYYRLLTCTLLSSSFLSEPAFSGSHLHGHALINEQGCFADGYVTFGPYTVKDTTATVEIEDYEGMPIYVCKGHALYFPPYFDQDHNGSSMSSYDLQINWGCEITWDTDMKYWTMEIRANGEFELRCGPI